MAYKEHFWEVGISPIACPDVYPLAIPPADKSLDVRACRDRHTRALGEARARYIRYYIAGAITDDRADPKMHATMTTTRRNSVVGDGRVCAPAGSRARQFPASRTTAPRGEKRAPFVRLRIHESKFQSYILESSIL